MGTLGFVGLVSLVAWVGKWLRRNGNGRGRRGRVRLVSLNGGGIHDAERRPLLG